MAIFLLICAAMFGLLQLSQEKYSSESMLSGAFQEARLALDQVVRDVDVAGFPSQNMYMVVPTSNPGSYAVGPVAWSPNYPSTTCLVGSAGTGTCTTPSDYDLIVETRLGTDPNVSWVRYQLIGTTLYRAVVPKSGSDPAAATASAGAMVPFLTNVMNNPGSAQLAQITTTYPSMFPGGKPQPVFQYSCDAPGGTTAPCQTVGPASTPLNIRDVDVTLIVATLQPDMQTHTMKLVELNGRGHRLNPTN
jgi:hypothetical protein